ncbi:hypothetical protein [Thermoactinomyces sp. DSM 45892]|uniref:hypothetical protein n=1 Tax=Thermoactinomyces sp. DSM 45892 TaxID=1882753 RepID=UPI000899F784|nr:hypothetical protein [Thermoactinomyces sp. DSM 45892]SDY10000.1 hypothetical protein SAMN05444416_1022 [Thermoactinomyces sp. DSM 45892]
MSRKGKRIITRRQEFIEPSTNYDMLIDKAFDYFVNLKKTEGGQAQYRQGLSFAYGLLLRLA